MDAAIYQATATDPNARISVPDPKESGSKQTAWTSITANLSVWGFATDDMANAITFNANFHKSFNQADLSS